MIEPTIITCTVCNGTGQVKAYVDTKVDPRGSVGGLQRCACDVCAGTGHVDQRALDGEWRRKGRVLRAIRQANSRTLIDAVETLGAGITQLSKAENGRIDPEPFVAKALAAGWRVP